MTGHLQTMQSLQAENSHLRQHAARLEQQLQALTSELADLKILVEHVADGIVCFDQDYMVTYANSTFARTLGYECLDGITTRMLLAEPPERITQLCQHVAAHGAWSGQLTYRQKHGSTIPGQVVVFLLPTPTRQQRVGCVIRFEPTQLHSPAPGSQALLQGIIDYLPAVVYIKDLLGRYLEISRYGATLLQLDRAQVLGKVDADVLPPAAVDACLSTDRQTLMTGMPVECEMVVPFDDGIHTFIATKFPIYNAMGQPSAVGGIATDITRRIRAEEALRASQSHLQAIFDNAAVAIGTTDIHGNWLEVNQRCLELLGYTREELRQMSHIDVTHPEDLASSREQFIALIEGKTNGYRLGKRYVRKDGSIFWADLAVAPIHDEHGVIQSVIGIVTDITERVQVEETYHALVDLSLQGLSITQDRRNVFVNRASTLLTGYSQAELLAMFPAEQNPLVHPDDREFMEEQFLKHLEGNAPPERYEYRIVRKDGEVRWIEAFHARMTYRGRPAIQSTAIDITERKRAEEALQQRVHELEALRATMNEILRELDQETRHRAILERAVQLLKAASGQLALYDAERHDLLILACYHMEPDVTGTRQPLTHGGTERVIQSRQPLVIPDYSNWAGRLPQYTALNAQTLLLVPLLAGEQVLGIISIGDARPGRIFTNTDRDLLTLFAQQATLAIQNAQLLAEAQRLATTDPLTELANRRSFFDLAQREFERARRYGHALSIMMLDIDHFKQVNDTYGHMAGDQVLRTLAWHCQAVLRAIDIIGRYGGEEIVMLLPDTDDIGAHRVAERLRRHPAQTEIPTNSGDMRITVSVGVATTDDATTITLERLIDQADQALYVAKQAGRNRVRVWTPAIHAPVIVPEPGTYGS